MLNINKNDIFMVYLVWCIRVRNEMKIHNSSNCKMIECCIMSMFDGMENGANKNYHA